LNLTHNPAFLAVSEFKMAASAELVDLAEPEGTCKKPTKPWNFHHRSPSFLVSWDF